MNNIKFLVFNLFVFFISIYLLTASGLNFYRTDAAQLRYEVTKSFIERNDINVPENMGIKGADGRYYSWLGIGTSLLAIPFYLAGAILEIPPKITVLILNPFFGAATVILIFLFVILLGYSRRISLLVAMSYGLGTFAWPLTKHWFDHTVETYFVFFSVYLMYMYTVNKKSPYILLSAFSLGFAFITRLTSILVLPALLILLIAHLTKQSDSKGILRPIVRDSALFSLAFIPFVCLNFWYNYYRFGSVLETGYTIIAAKTGLDLFSGTSLLTGLSGFLIRPGKGFFYYSPVAILSLFSFIPFVKRHPGLGFSIILIITSYITFLSKYIYWHGDWAWGPRYLLVTTPFFIIPLAEFLDSHIYRSKQYIKKAVYLLLIVSLIVQVAAIAVDFQSYFVDLTFEKKVKFNIALGSGVQKITEPPSEIYFNWNYSPIIAQFRFIYDIGEQIGGYKYLLPPDAASKYEKFKAAPSHNIFDFWWLYIYFISGRYDGIAIALILSSLIIYTTIRLMRLSTVTIDKV